MDSQASSTLIGQHMLDAFKLMPCSTHFFQPPHLGLLPGLAAHFCFLLRRGVRDMAHGLSLSGGSYMLAKHMLLYYCHRAIQPTQ